MWWPRRRQCKRGPLRRTCRVSPPHAAPTYPPPSQNTPAPRSGGSAHVYRLPGAGPGDRLQRRGQGDAAAHGTGAVGAPPQGSTAGQLANDGRSDAARSAGVAATYHSPTVYHRPLSASQPHALSLPLSGTRLPTPPALAALKVKSLHGAQGGHSQHQSITLMPMPARALPPVPAAQAAQISCTCRPAAGGARGTGT